MSNPETKSKRMKAFELKQPVVGKANIVSVSVLFHVVLLLFRLFFQIWHKKHATHKIAIRGFSMAWICSLSILF